MYKLRKHPILRFFTRLVGYYAVLAFIATAGFLPTQGYAQSVLSLPQPGRMVTITPTYSPAIISGMTMFSNDPLKFDFLVDVGDDELSGENLEKETSKLIKYFLASLTIPEDEMWVNLSPYEKDRIIPNEFGQTEMGRDLLAQDYMLKQLTASLMYPKDELGNEFWQRVYERAHELYGTSEIPMNTFNKVWIIPEKADVYVEGNSVYVVNSRLKVLLEEDYLALESNVDSTKHGLGDVKEGDLKKISEVSSKVIKEVIIPEIEREVNEGKTFANLRQIYNSMILAVWYKKNLKESLLGEIYINQGKTKGVDVEDKEINQKIYNQYVQAFEKGVYDFIKEDYDPATQEMIARKYFSGGVGLGLGDAEIAREMKEIKDPDLAGLSKSRFSDSARLRKVIGHFRGVDGDNEWLLDGGRSRKKSTTDNVMTASKQYWEYEGKTYEVGSNRYFQLFGRKMISRSEIKKDTKILGKYLQRLSEFILKGNDFRLDFEPNQPINAHLIGRRFIHLESFSQAEKNTKGSEQSIDRVGYVFEINWREDGSFELINPMIETGPHMYRRMPSRLNVVRGSEMPEYSDLETKRGLLFFVPLQTYYRQGILKDRTLISALEQLATKAVTDSDTRARGGAFIKENFNEKGFLLPEAKVDYELARLVYPQPKMEIYQMKVRYDVNPHGYFVEKDYSNKAVFGYVDEPVLNSMTYTDSPFNSHLSSFEFHEILGLGPDAITASKRGAYLYNDQNNIFSDTAMPARNDGRDNETKGGIDFNPANLDMNAQGTQIEMNTPVNLEYLYNTNVEGFLPVIINITPVTSMPMFLGESGEKSETTLSQL